MIDDFMISEIIIFDDISKIDITSEEDLDGAYPVIDEFLPIRKFEIPRDVVKIIIDRFKDCTTIHTNNYYETIKFLKENSLTLEDCLEIIHKLKVSDYYKNTISTNPDFAGNNLIIFEPKVVELFDGRVFKDLIIYLKLDLDETTRDAIALVSIHKGIRNALPYEDEE